MLLSTILLKQSSPINCILNIKLDTSDVRMQHFCIATPKYGGLYRTCYDIRNTQYFVIFFSSYECKNEIWPTGRGVNF